MDSKTLRATFAEHFPEQQNPIIVQAPGRVNLLGEHTDYNDGFVLPMAVDPSVYLAATANASGIVRMFAADYEESDSFALDGIKPHPKKQWSNYIRGVCHIMQKALAQRLPGMDLVIQGNIPQGAGLSSSAALEVAAAVAVSRLANLDVQPEQLIHWAQRAENEFVGVQCGIMDQFISLLGRAGHALLLDCRSLEYRQIPADFGAWGAAVAVIDSGVSRGLVDSQYNQRRRECEAAVAALQVVFPGMTSLRDAGPAALELINALPEPINRRARHVVTENQRVKAAAAALGSRDLQAFGELMNASHDSLRDDYAVSCRELDLLVALVRENHSVLGSRMTGAGFGGCTVSLLPQGEIEDLQKRVLPRYAAKSGCKPRLFLFQAAPGATSRQTVKRRSQAGTSA